MLNGFIADRVFYDSCGPLGVKPQALFRFEPDRTVRVQIALVHHDFDSTIGERLLRDKCRCGNVSPISIVSCDRCHRLLERIDPVGRYAVRLVFDDGHNTGLYSWDVLRRLGEQHATNWARYEQRLQEVGMSRDRDVTKLAALVRKVVPPGAAGG